MCVAVGIGPAEVLALDASTFDALEAEAAAGRERWSIERELAAELVELSSAQLVAFLAANVKKGTKLPQPIRVPRPGDDAGVDAPASSSRSGAAAFAARFAPHTTGAV